MAESGVKYNADDIVMIAKTSEGKLVWLENSTIDAGLNHIMSRADDFVTQGIPKDQLSLYVISGLKNGKIVGYQGRGIGRPIYEFVYQGTTRRVAITIGSNGYVVGANPVSMK